MGGGVGLVDGSYVGKSVGGCVGRALGIMVGAPVGDEVGAVVGIEVTAGSLQSMKPLLPHSRAPSIQVSLQQSPPSQSQFAVL